MNSEEKYKVCVRHSPRWRDKKAASLGVRVGSPNWEDEKFSAILNFAASHFDTIRIDVTDALYRHNILAEGDISEKEALCRANALGSLWLARHDDLIKACPIKPILVRWAQWYEHKDYNDTLNRFTRAYKDNAVFHDAIEADIAHFYQRKNNLGKEHEKQYSRNFLIEEVAVSTIQAKELPCVKIYPGDELKCLYVVRHGLVEDAPEGLKYEQYAKIKFHTRYAYKHLHSSNNRSENVAA